MKSFPVNKMFPGNTVAEMMVNIHCAQLRCKWWVTHYDVKGDYVRAMKFELAACRLWNHWEALLDLHDAEHWQFWKK